MRGILFLLMLVSYSCFGQLGWSKSEIIKLRGQPTNMLTKNGECHMQYTYDNYRDDGSLGCAYILNSEGYSRVFTQIYKVEDINLLVKTYSSLGYVRLDDLKWKDYKTDIVFKIWKDGDFCFSGMYYED